jgi:hypothetical protein
MGSVVTENLQFYYGRPSDRLEIDYLAACELRG